MALLALAAFTPKEAWAFSLASPLGIDASGNVALTGTVPVANGGTNLTAALDDNVMIGNATTWLSAALPSCTDSGGNHLNYVTGSHAITCGTSSAASITPQIAMTSETKVPAGTTNYFMSPGGQMSQTEAEMHTPFSAGTWKNLRCNASAAPGGSGIIVSVAKNTCGSAMTFTSVPSVTLTAANTAVADTSNTFVTAANDCVVVKLAPSGTTTTAAYVKCTIQKTTN